MKLKNIEFYSTPSGEVMIKMAGEPLKKYVESNTELTSLMIEVISEFYADAFDALCKVYTRSEMNKRYFEYLIVHRFIRCNFSEYDNTNDIDQSGVFRFEYVKCPLRGECKYCDIICSPKFNSKLTDREHEVMKLYYESFPTDQIADRLFISIKTVEKHKSNALKKLKLHSLAEFNSYASNHNLFNNQ